MRIPKAEIIDYLTRHEQLAQSGEARRLLADPVDTEAEGGLLAQLGICVLDLERYFGQPALR